MLGANSSATKKKLLHKVCFRNLVLTSVAVFAITCCSSVVFAAELTKQDCIQSASIEQRVNLSAGVATETIQVTTPLHIELPATVDNEIYYECLLANGLVDQKGPEQFVAKQDRCRSQTRLHAVSANDGTPRISDAADSQDFADCMESNITVDVLDNEK